MKKLLFLLLTIVIYACPPSSIVNKNCSRGYYNFSIPISFNPIDSIIAFGDTITVISQFPNELVSINSSENFIFDDIDFRPIVTFAKLDTPYFENFLYYPYTGFFDFYADSTYNLKISGNSIGLKFDYSGNGYYLEFKFIPRRKGIYYFQFGSAYFSHSNSDDTPIIHSIDSACETNNWSPYFNTNGNNNHKELLKESIYEFARNDMYEKWNQNSSVYGKHCFKVE